MTKTYMYVCNMYMPMYYVHVPCIVLHVSMCVVHVYVRAHTWSALDGEREREGGRRK